LHVKNTRKVCKTAPAFAGREAVSSVCAKELSVLTGVSAVWVFRLKHERDREPVFALYVGKYGEILFRETA